MIDLSKIDIAFKQTGSSCVLSSYGIAFNYFTGESVTSVFEAYCRHFNLTFATWQEAEQKYATHFDGEWRRRDCKGCKVIMDLHSNSTEPEFVTARNLFHQQFYQDTLGSEATIHQRLLDEESILGLGYRTNGVHVVCAFINQTSLFIRDPEKPNFIIPTLGLSSGGRVLVDSFLNVRI